MVLLAIVSSGWLVGCGEGEDDGYSTADAAESPGISVRVPDLSDTALRGAELFGANCSECHGASAGGSSQGPPLVDKIWQFGDMDPVPGLSPEEVNMIICYVRELQYANGIFSDPAGLVACQG